MNCRGPEVAVVVIMVQRSAGDLRRPISPADGVGRPVAERRRHDGRRLKTVRDVSAGGVAFRRTPQGVEVVLVGRLEPERWVLPKGTPTRGESMEQTAVREVSEET